MNEESFPISCFTLRSLSRVPGEQYSYKLAQYTGFLYEGGDAGWAPCVKGQFTPCVT